MVRLARAVPSGSEKAPAKIFLLNAKIVSSVPETVIPLNVGGWFTKTVTVVEMVL